MKRRNAIILGIFSIWPLIYIPVTILIVSFGIIFQKTIGSPEGILPFFLIIHTATMFEILGILAYYITWIFKTDRVASDKKALWAVVLFCANMIAIPVFWYLYFWKPSTLPHQDGANSGAPSEVTH